MRLIRSFLRDTSGATAIEYAIIGSLVAVAIIGGATAVGNSIINLYGGLNNDVTGALN